MSLFYSEYNIIQPTDFRFNLNFYVILARKMLQVVLISIYMNIIWILYKQSPKVKFDNRYILILWCHARSRLFAPYQRWGQEADN